MITIAMHVLFGVLLGAVVITIVITLILIGLIRTYSKRLEEMDKLLRKIYADEIKSLQE